MPKYSNRRILKLLNGLTCHCNSDAHVLSTMESLQAERRKREKELELLRNSEPKLEKEISSLKEGLKQMRKDMQVIEVLCDSRFYAYRSTIILTTSCERLKGLKATSLNSRKAISSS